MRTRTAGRVRLDALRQLNLRLAHHMRFHRLRQALPVILLDLRKQPLAAGVVECDGVGVASSDYSLFRFRRLRRPIFPIDADARFDGRP